MHLLASTVLIADRLGVSLEMVYRSVGSGFQLGTRATLGENSGRRFLVWFALAPTNLIPSPKCGDLEMAVEPKLEEAIAQTIAQLKIELGLLDLAIQAIERLSDIRGAQGGPRARKAEGKGDVATHAAAFVRNL